MFYIEKENWIYHLSQSEHSLLCKLLYLSCDNSCDIWKEAVSENRNQSLWKIKSDSTSLCNVRTETFLAAFLVAFKLTYIVSRIEKKLCRFVKRIRLTIGSKARLLNGISHIEAASSPYSSSSSCVSSLSLPAYPGKTRKNIRIDILNTNHRYVLSEMSLDRYKY